VPVGILEERWDSAKFMATFADLFSTWDLKDIREYIELMAAHADSVCEEVSKRFNEFFFFPIFREALKTRQSWTKWLIECVKVLSTGGYSVEDLDGLKTSISQFFSGVHEEATDKLVDPAEFDHLVEHLVAEHGVLIVEQFMLELKTYCTNGETENETAEKSQVEVRLASILDTFFGEKETKSALKFNNRIDIEIEKGDMSEETSAILARIKVPGSIRVLETKVLLKHEFLSHFSTSANDAELKGIFEILERMLIPSTEASLNVSASQRNNDRVPIEDAAITSIADLCQFQNSSITGVCKKAVAIMNDAFDQIYSAKSHKGRIALIETTSSEEEDGDAPQTLLRCVACDSAQESSLYGSALSEYGLDFSIYECTPEQLLETQQDLRNFVATQLKDKKHVVIGVIGFDVGIQDHSPAEDIKFIEVCDKSEAYNSFRK
jgi:hypothetical protein